MQSRCLSRLVARRIAFSLVLVPFSALVAVLHLARDARASGLSEDFAIPSGDISLAATLRLPAGGGPSPGVVFLHGSGCTTRGDLAHFVEPFVDAGWATLCFDKRGCGESGGSWMKSSLADLASDAETALQWLAARSEVDTSRVGLWCISQSGWIGPIVANRGSSGVRFLIVVTGGGASPREVEEFGYDQNLLTAGRSLDATPAARDLLDDYFSYLSTGAGLQDLLARIEAVRHEPWYAALDLERVLPSEATRPAWAWVGSYRPATDIENLEVPVLVLLAGQDEHSPMPLTAERWTEALVRSGVRGSRVVIFPEASHALQVGGHARAGEHPLAAGSFELIGAWLDSIVN